MTRPMANIKIVRQVYQRGLKTVVSYLVQIQRGGKKRIYNHVSKHCRIWLENNSTAIQYMNFKIYPTELINRFGIPTNKFKLLYPVQYINYCNAMHILGIKDG